MNVSIMLYGKGHPDLLPRASEAFAWITERSGISINPDWVRSKTQPDPGLIDGRPMLSPGDVSWQEIPQTPTVIFFWDAAGKSPWAYGAAYPVWHYRGGNNLCDVATIPYNTPWDLWKPAEGFPAYLQPILVHEFIHCLIFWLRDRFGFNILDTEPSPDKPHIDCGKYPRDSWAVHCYAEVLSQINEPMREQLESLNQSYTSE